MNWTTEGCLYQGAVTIKGLECLFANTVQVVVQFAVLAAFIFLIIGGIKFLASGGDSKSVESAQNTITYAILGLVLLVVIWLILLFIKDFTGIDVTQFNLNVRL